MIAGIVAGQGLTPQEFTVTIASGTVSSNLTSFPVMVRLSDMPARFWNNVKSNGGDVRATTTGDVTIPHDLSRFDYEAQDGVLWVRMTVSSASNTSFKITCGDPALEMLASNDANGREAVWQDYEAVYLLGEDSVDRSGNSARLRVLGDPDLFEQTAISGDINCHEGVAADGTYYYGFDDAAIRKFDSSWSLVTENTSLGTGAGNPGIDALGGGDVHGGKLYVAAAAGATQYLAVYSASDLSFIEAFDIQSFASGAADMFYNTEDDLLYTIRWGVGLGDRIIKISPTDGTSQGEILLNTSGGTLSEAQGIVKWRGAFWISDDAADEIYRVETDGTVTHTGLFGTTDPTSEGLCVSPGGDGLLWLTDSGTVEHVRTIKPLDLNLSGGGGVDIWADARLVADLALTGALGTSWTVGASFKPDDTVQRSFLGISATGGYSATANVHCYCDNVGGATIHLGVFDGSNSWFYTSPAQVPSTSVMQRMNLIYDGTTARHLYFNGGNKGTDNTITSRGSGVSHIVIGNPLENIAADAWRGQIGFVYARVGVLSDAWIAAEYANLNTPGTFYSVS